MECNKAIRGSVFAAAEVKVQNHPHKHYDAAKKKRYNLETTEVKRAETLLGLYATKRARYDGNMS